MNKNFNLNQVLLIGIATVLLLLTAASFYLLQDPSAPLPFAISPTDTSASLLPSEVQPTSSSPTPPPTRQTSYTPFASIGTPTSVTTTEVTPGGTTPTRSASAIPTQSPSGLTPTPRQPTSTSRAYPGPGTSSPQPSIAPTNTASPTTTGSTAVPTITPTLTSGEHVVTGRILQNSTPVPNVVVSFTDDNPSRLSTTNSGGHYFFTTLAPGTSFTLQYTRADNPQIIPAAQVASLAWIVGTLPTGVNEIDLPDLDLSLNINGNLFELDTPVDGAAFSAAAIGPNNPLEFVWTSYEQGEYYFVELGLAGDDTPLWTSDTTAATDIMWNGTLESDDHVSEGAYWWHVGVKKTVGAFDMFIFTPNNDLIFNP
jgi:hypothetical protein